MSLINQMLRDLDERRGPVNESQVAALQGMGLISIKRFKWSDSMTFTAWGVAGLVAILAVYQASMRWHSGSEPESVIIPQAVAELAQPEQNARLEAVSTQENFSAAALAATTIKPEVTEKALDIPVVPRIEPILAAAPKLQAEAVIRPVKQLTPEQKAERLFAKAQQALSGHRQQAGEHLLRQALDEYARHMGARSQLAALLLSRQQGDEAELLLAEGLAIDVHQLALARPYAQLLAARDEAVAALQTLDRAVGQRQADAETLALRAAILYRMERHTESAAAYRRAVQIQPKRALWWTGLAVALEQGGQSRQALSAFQRAAELPLDKPVDDYVKQRIHALSGNNFHD